jgi:hypothetical protein
VWALREMNGHVDTLKASVTGPFAEVNILMFVQLLWALPVSSLTISWLGYNNASSSSNIDIRGQTIELGRLKNAVNIVQESILAQREAIKGPQVTDC